MPFSFTSALDAKNCLFNAILERTCSSISSINYITSNSTFTTTSMVLFLCYAAVCSATQIPRVVLMAINRHGGLAWQSLLAALVSLGVAWLVWRSAGMTGVVAAMLLGEALVWFTATRAVHRLRTPRVAA